MTYTRYFSALRVKVLVAILCSFIWPSYEKTNFSPSYKGSFSCVWGGGPRVVISTAAFHARVRGSFHGLGGLKKTKMFIPHPLIMLSNVEASVTER